MTDHLDRLAAAVDAAVTTVAGLDEAAREAGQALQRAIEDIHREGLTTIVRALREDPRGKELLFDLVDDPVVRTLFVMHGLIRSDAPPPPEPEPAGAFIPIGSIGVRRAGDGWFPGPALADLPTGRAVAVDAGSQSVLVIRLEGVHAYKNECAHQARPLDTGLVDPEAGTITCPWHGFCYDAATGECLSAPQAMLETVRFDVRDGVVWVKP